MCHVFHLGPIAAQNQRARIGQSESHDWPVSGRRTGTEPCLPVMSAPQGHRRMVLGVWRGAWVITLPPPLSTDFLLRMLNSPVGNCEGPPLNFDKFWLSEKNFQVFWRHLHSQMMTNGQWCSLGPEMLDDSVARSPHFFPNVFSVSLSGRIYWTPSQCKVFCQIQILLKDVIFKNSFYILMGFCTVILSTI